MGDLWAAAPKMVSPRRHDDDDDGNSVKPIDTGIDCCSIIESNYS